MAHRVCFRKRLFVYAAIFCTFAQANSSDTHTGKVKTEDASANQISVYTDRALISQTFKVTPGNEGQLKIYGLTDDWVKESLQLNYLTDEKLYSANSVAWSNDLLNRNRLYQTMIGKSVELIGGGLNVPVQGVMLSYQQGIALVQGTNGRQYIVDLHDPQGIRIAAREELFQEQDYQSFLTASFDSAAKNGSLQMSYIISGLSYQSSYRMMVDANNLGDFDLSVLLRNQTDINYDHANVQLVAGDFPAPQYSQRSLMAQNAMESSGAAGVERVGEAMVIPLPDMTSIPAGSTQQLTLYKDQQLKLSSYYRLSFYGRSNSGRSSIEERPQHYYRFKAGQDLPAGNVAIFQKNSAGVNLISGVSQIGRVVKGENIQLATGEALAVSIKRERLSQRQSSDTLQSRWKVAITNDKKESVTVQLSDRDYGINRFEEVQGASVMNYNTLTVDVPAGSVQEVLFTSVYNK